MQVLNGACRRQANLQLPLICSMTHSILLQSSYQQTLRDSLASVLIGMLPQGLGLPGEVLISRLGQAPGHNPSYSLVYW